MDIRSNNAPADAWSSQIQACWHGMEVEKVTCYPAENVLYIDVANDKLPSQTTYVELCRLFRLAYASDAEVIVIPTCRQDMTADACDLDLISTVLLEVSPAYRRWHKALTWSFVSRQITVTCSHALVLQRLERKRFKETVKRLCTRMGYPSPDIAMRVSESSPTISTVKKTTAHPMPQPPCALPQQPSAKKNVNNTVKKPAEGILLGRAIRSTSKAIRELTEEENQAVCSGTVFDMKVRALKSGRRLFIFSITDQTDSIECKYFAEEEQAKTLEKQLEMADAIKVRGKTRVDQFSQELTFLVSDINLVQPICRTDVAQVKRVELHLHTQMSPLDGVSSLKKILKLAKDMGHDAVAVTDHGVVQAFPEAYALGKTFGIKILYGMEAYIFDDAIPDKLKPKLYHCILLAKNATGLENLYKLVTESHLRYFKKRPRIPKRLLTYAREGLVVGSACEAGEVVQHLLHHPDDHQGLVDTASFYDYLEIQPIENNLFLVRKELVEKEEDLRTLNQRIWALGEEIGKPVVATCDVHFCNAEDAICRGIIMAGKGFKDAEEQAPLYYRSTTEMLEAFAYLGEDAAYAAVVENPRKIVADFEVLKPVPEELFAPKIDGAEDEIVRLTMSKAHRLYGEELPEVVSKRIDKELRAIIGNQFAVLYYIAHMLVQKSNEDGYVVGSRGSVGSSVVAFLTDITEVNALPPHYRCPACCHSIFFDSGTAGAGVDMPDQRCPQCNTAMIKDGFDIPFEIFLGFKGDKVPDIDLNFSGDYQARAHQYTEHLFGLDQVFRAGTIATVADKTAFGYVNKFFEARGEQKRMAEINRLCKGCSGVKRTTGQHPGGLMVIPRQEDVHRFTPLQRPADDVSSEIITTHFDYHSISERLVKLDILGHDDPTVIKMLEDITGVSIQDVPLDDEKTLSLFSSVDALALTPQRLRSTVATYGIPEFNTKFVRQMLEDTKPKSFSDLLRISGFSHGTDVWLNNAQDLIRNEIAEVSETISTRDDIMLYLMQHGMEAVDAFAIMEGVRKGRGLKEEQEEKMRENQIPRWFIDSCKKIKYLFPKAHAVAYVMMAFRIAWFKLNYPLAFYASYFTVRGAEDFDAEVITAGEQAVLKKIQEIYGKGLQATTKENRQVSVLEVALELYARGYSILPVDIEKSDAKKFIIEGKALRPPFIGIAGLGKTMAYSIVEARDKKPFSSVEDMQKRGHVGDTMVLEMKRLKVLQDLPETDQIILF